MTNNNQNHNPKRDPMTTRLESILKTLVRQVTGNLYLEPDSFNERVEQLASRLANDGVIVLVGRLHPQFHGQRNQHVQAWVNAYAQLYYLLCMGLFDTTDEPTAYIADNKYPVIVVFEARMLVVARVLTGLIIPYIALRQSDGQASRAELRGMIEMMLEELAATNLPHEKYTHIRDRGLELLDTLLKSEIQQVSLTEFSRQFILDEGSTQTPIQNPPRPDSLPELPKQKPTTMPLSPKDSPDNILRIPTPDTRSKSSAPIPPPSLSDRFRRKEY